MTDREGVKSLYTFLREFTKLRSKTISNYKDHEWIKFVSDIHHEYDDITLHFRDKTAEDDADDDLTLLKVHRSLFTEKCPEPYNSFKKWLVQGWNEYTNSVSIEEKKLISPATENTEAVYENFSDDQSRVNDYNRWKEERGRWVKEQIKIKNTRDLFLELYQRHIDLERESETLEMIVACGNLTDKKHPGVNHPVLLKRVKTEYDAKTDTIKIVDTDVAPELYLQFLQDVQIEYTKKLAHELSENEYHPLDRVDTPDFLKILVRQISKNGVFVEQNDNIDPDARLIIQYQPMFIIRKRTDGAIKALEAIVDDIDEADFIPSHISEIVSGGTIEVPKDKEETIEERLAAVGGEDVDILLSKEANREQLEIARRVEQYNAVLVQGPPGTGKTHTIANLMGHFLAQGKSVLVTSHTKKALSVLKEKVSPGIQDLCVSVLDDSNKDMEKSIDGITDSMGRMTSYGLQKEIESIKVERDTIIKELADTRRKLYSIINSETQSIVFAGESVSPTEAAKYVYKNKDSLSYIPGMVEINSTLPLTIDELADLYKSNSVIQEKDEKELIAGIPDPCELPGVEVARNLFQKEKSLQSKVNEILQNMGWSLQKDSGEFIYQIPTKLHVKNLNSEKLRSLNDYISEFKTVESWMKTVIIDGKRGGAFERRWRTLHDSVSACCQITEEYIEQSLGKSVNVPDGCISEGFLSDIDRIIEIFEKKGKISKVNLMLKPNMEHIMKDVSINGKPISNEEDAKCIRQYYVLQKAREDAGRIWDELLTPQGVSEFKDLDYDYPELTAKKRLIKVDTLLKWYEQKYVNLKHLIEESGLDIGEIAGIEEDDTDNEELDKVLDVIKITLPNIVSILLSSEEIRTIQEQIESYKGILQTADRASLETCMNIVRALDSREISEYNSAYDSIVLQYAKYDLQNKRREYLERISRVAPRWAEAIMNREGIHGNGVIPENIKGAWKWKQYYEILNELTKESYGELQEKSLSLSVEYRRVTAKYAEKLAWYHLLKSTEADIDIKQALQGWKLTVKKIGKGTGKNAPMYRKQARKLMSKCQKAVPAWIMPINKALESLDPHSNKFDVVIIDEASQSDISAIAILYMAKKVIIVGDDKQVSPLAVGIDLEEIQSLIAMYLANTVANAHLYTAKTSLYDIAATTFQPLMLREHFRCVPEIIGFSNGLSYDYKIKPLRDESDSSLLPAVVQYRVANGKRSGKSKINKEEAMTILALMKACMQIPEYNNKTFGIISMLGDEQAKYIRQLIAKHIDPIENEERRILCGNASNFQGDERDVIFLSMVDSNEGNGPLSLVGFGIEDATRKRYNVAASRARDQLWVVNSLDPYNDLKEDDLRKRLIEYAINPQAFTEKIRQVEQGSESPFEEEVAKYLVARGYNIIQQWKVGSYRLDIVVTYNNLKVAIECDGERYHSSEEQIRADMERQTILERCGWRFIRIRGSEYYRDPEKTMERVIKELNKAQIRPQSSVSELELSRDTDLLQRVKSQAERILAELNDENEQAEIDIETIADALSADNIAQTDKTSSKTEKVISKKKVEKSSKTDHQEESYKQLSFEELIDTVVDMGEGKKTSFSDKGSGYVSTVKDIVDDLDVSKNVGNSEKIYVGKESKPPRRGSISIAEVYKRVSDRRESKNRGISFKLANDLSDAGLKYVDRSISRIIWVIYDSYKVETAQRIFEKYNCRYSLEERGSIATGGVKAWRVIISE